MLPRMKLDSVGHGNSSNCSICLESYSKPRKLPQCSHSFCENCIREYVSLKLKDTRDSFLCPSCRVINHVPTNHGDVNEWIKSLDKNEELMSSEKLQGAEKITGTCSSCAEFGVSSKAVKYCADCFEAFCKPCFIGRHSFKPFKNHQVTDTEEATNDIIKTIDLQTCIQLKRECMCTVHCGKQLEFYCQDDDSFCCATCAVIEHRKCNQVVHLNDKRMEKETKSEQTQVIGLYEKLLAYAKTLTEAIDKSMKTNKKQAGVINSALQEARAKINKLFDVLEDTVNLHAKSVTKKTAISADQDLEILQGTIENLTQSLSFIERVREHGSVNHIYVTTHNMKEKLRQFEATVLDICENHDDVVPVLEIHKKLQNLLDLNQDNISELATIAEKNDKHLPHFQTRSLLKDCKIEKQAEKALDESCTGTLSPLLTSISLLPNKSVVFVDANNSRCILLNDKFDLIGINIIPKDGVDGIKGLYSCTYMENRTIAVSAPSQRKIFFLTADEEFSVTHYITTKYTPQAIHGIQGGDIAVAWTDPVAFGIISTDEQATARVYFCRDKSGRQLRWFNYIAVDKLRNHVIQPCALDRAIYCFDFDGFPQFKYTSSFLSYPGDVSIDGDGNIYAFDYWRANIHVISPTGKALRIIREGPRFPRAISFHKDGKQFVIANTAGSSHVVTRYKLTEGVCR